MNGCLFSRRPGPIIMSTETRDGAPALMRLLQLSSPMLPVGAYAYSQGLEHAVHAGWVHDERTAHAWIGGVLREGLMRLDVPVLARLYHAWHMADYVAVHWWSSFLHASRESAELQREDRHLGQALARLLRDLEIGDAADWMTCAHASFAGMFTLAVVRWEIPLRMATQGYLWAWVENQAAAAMKLIPLGQTAGQRILYDAATVIPAIADEGLALADDDIGYAAPGLALGSALHENQYSRLFRS